MDEKMTTEAKMQNDPKGEASFVAAGSELSEEQLRQVCAGGFFGNQSYKTGDTIMFPCSSDGTSTVLWTCVEGSKVISSKPVRRWGTAYWTTLDEIETVWECSQCGERWCFNDMTGFRRLS